MGGGIPSADVNGTTQPLIYCRGRNPDAERGYRADWRGRCADASGAHEETVAGAQLQDFFKAIQRRGWKIYRIINVSSKGIVRGKLSV